MHEIMTKWLFYHPFVSVDPYLSNFGEKLKNTRKICHFENLIKLKKNMDEMSEACHIDIFIN